MPGDVLYITIGKERVEQELQALNGWRPGMLLNTLQCTGQLSPHPAPTTKCHPAPNVNTVAAENRRQVAAGQMDLSQAGGHRARVVDGFNYITKVESRACWWIASMGQEAEVKQESQVSE